ncbi:uncharacterized mitochondrial protein AtMg00860-like [Rutidosis leptorrhynchoides]|uniref:uncharacterized mitochondrial protein AtMg00860-like n=1 Tax=Rutidosis leptorrhynchoides TaxID=125765 RepID=UPI003A98F0B5
MKLKFTKCSFREEVGKFLGHIVTPRGIRANPNKIEAVEQMQSPKSRKDALTCFLLKEAERSLPFFHTLKNLLKKSDFKWTEEAEKAFLEMKALLKELPTLTAPEVGETLMLYLTTSKEAISSVLVTDMGQMHVYFVSKALSGSEVN